jgi:tetratricopeptide (TPR) repeat protein
MHVRTILSLSVAALCCMPTVALADAVRARALFQKAETHFKLGEFKNALPLYKRAYRAKALPAFLFNIGQCHRYLGNCTKAEFFFQQFLAQVPHSPHATTIRTIVEQCKPREKEAAPVVVIRPRRAIPRKDGSRRRRVLLGTGIGVSAALLITGALTGALAHDRSQTFKDPNTPQSNLRGLEDQGTALATASIVTLAVGGASAVATVLIYLLYPKEAPRAQVTAAPLPGGGALLLQGRF